MKGSVKLEKLIITAALTGAEVTKEQQPSLPVTPDEIAQAAYECYKAGASIVHVHARDAEGNPTQDSMCIKKLKRKSKLNAILLFNLLRVERYGIRLSKGCNLLI